MKEMFVLLSQKGKLIKMSSKLTTNWVSLFVNQGICVLMRESKINW